MGRHKKRGRKPLPETERKRRKKEQQTAWKKENLKHMHVWFNLSRDAELIEYLDGTKNKSDVFREALREYIANHKNNE